MISISQLVEFIQWLCCVLLTVRAICVLNNMTYRTRVWMLLPYLFVALSAGALGAAPFFRGSTLWDIGLPALSLEDVANPLLIISITVVLFIDPRFRPRTGKKCNGEKHADK